MRVASKCQRPTRTITGASGIKKEKKSRRCRRPLQSGRDGSQSIWWMQSWKPGEERERGSQLGNRSMFYVPGCVYIVRTDRLLRTRWSRAGPAQGLSAHVKLICFWTTTVTHNWIIPCWLRTHLSVCVNLRAKCAFIKSTLCRPFATGVVMRLRRVRNGGGGAGGVCGPDTCVCVCVCVCVWFHFLRASWVNSNTLWYYWRWRRFIGRHPSVSGWRPSEIRHVRGTQSIDPCYGRYPPPAPLAADWNGPALSRRRRRTRQVQRHVMADSTKRRLFCQPRRRCCRGRDVTE